MKYARLGTWLKGHGSVLVGMSFVGVHSSADSLSEKSSMASSFSSDQVRFGLVLVKNFLQNFFCCKNFNENPQVPKFFCNTCLKVSLLKDDDDKGTFLEEPLCTYTGHTADILDLSWSKVRINIRDN